MHQRRRLQGGARAHQVWGRRQFNALAMDRHRCCGPPTTSHVEIARALIADKAAVDAANDFGITPLLQASGIGDAAMVELLLRSGAESEHGTSRRRDAAARRAARSGSVPAVRLLLARGVDVNAAEKVQKTTALMWAAAEGHVDVVECSSRRAPTSTVRGTSPR